MTITLKPESKGKRYSVEDFKPLKDHYQERRLQVHVMGEYARRGLEAVRDALELVQAYFRLQKIDFVRHYLPFKPELLEHATTAQSYQRIVTDLNNPTQIALVTADVKANQLVLAGPGSGKTRTLVHRCAYLLRVERISSRSILVCCFNRQAAVELRRRLHQLVGDDARGVLILTYHGLAMRLLGRSPIPFSGPGALTKATRSPEPDFNALITDAVQLLSGKTTCPGIETDEVRDRLLAGFQHILIDEYQDIDAPQYELISALAGRTRDHEDEKLSLFAVGDDDQNIYSFRGANIEFIRRFQQDYQARVGHLIENYRSTRYIIEAANQWIAANQDRMKQTHPIRIDHQRELLPPGGLFGRQDPQGRGRVQVVAVRSSAEIAAASLAEIQRLMALGVSDPAEIAILTPAHKQLAQIRAAVETAGIPIQWRPRGKMLPLGQIREISQFSCHLRQRGPDLVRASKLLAEAQLLLSQSENNPWSHWVRQTLTEWQLESGDAELPIQAASEFYHAATWESRHDHATGTGVILSTIHGAKGTEHRHVVVVNEPFEDQKSAGSEEYRRLFYVGMTRARESLIVLESAQKTSLSILIADGPAIHRRVAVTPLPSSRETIQYTAIGLNEIDLGYAGRHPATAPIHTALRKLQPGDRLSLRSTGDADVHVYADSGTSVGRLARATSAEWRSRLSQVREVRVLAVLQRRADQDDQLDRQKHYRVEEWEVPVLEIVWAQSGANRG